MKHWTRRARTSSCCQNWQHHSSSCSTQHNSSLWPCWEVQNWFRNIQAKEIHVISEWKLLATIYWLFLIITLDNIIFYMGVQNKPSLEWWTFQRPESKGTNHVLSSIFSPFSIIATVKPTKLKYLLTVALSWVGKWDKATLGSIDRKYIYIFYIIYNFINFIVWIMVIKIL